MELTEAIIEFEKRINDLKEGRADLVEDTIQRLAPRAEELGYGTYQRKMLDLAMSVGFPKDYEEIKRLLQESEAMCEIVFKTFTLPIRAMLDDMGLQYEMEYRMKSVYSIWRKMRNGKCFDEVYDLFACRIIYKPMTDGPDFLDQEKLTCWRIYNTILALYRVHPDRIRDWVTHPKPSGYQALQLTAMGPDCNWIEIQIRSERMHHEAEYGQAAHWKYKNESKAM